MTPIERQRRIAEIDDRLKAMRQEEEALRDERGQHEEQLIEYMLDAGTESIRIVLPDGSKKTVFIRNEVWASALDVDTLRNHPDTAGLVKETVNGQTLSAWVRELDRDDDGQPILPDELREAIKVSTPIRIGTRKA